MTSTNFSIGFGENTKSSSKVLKPPGGGSSDLFGADNQPQTPRSMNKNRMQSNIFAAPAGEAHKAGNGDTPRRAVTGQDSHNRLFGEADRPYTPAKNHMKSNLPIGPADLVDNGKTNGHHSSSSSNGSSNGASGKMNGHHQNGNGTAAVSNGHSNGTTANGHSNGVGSSASSQNGSSHKTGNPVTGEGYKSGGAAAEINTSVPALNGGGHVINKNRIPPGGFSSGLW